MSTTLLSAFYDIDFLCKVRGGTRREEGGRAGSPSSFQTLPLFSAFGGPLPTLTFLGPGENPEVCRSCAGALWAGRRSREGGKDKRERL